jgi:hypothetical protein
VINANVIITTASSSRASSATLASAATETFSYSPLARSILRFHSGAHSIVHPIEAKDAVVLAAGEFLPTLNYIFTAIGHPDAVKVHHRMTGMRHDVKAATIAVNPALHDREFSHTSANSIEGHIPSPHPHSQCKIVVRGRLTIRFLDAEPDRRDYLIGMARQVCTVVHTGKASERGIGLGTDRCYYDDGKGNDVCDQSSAHFASLLLRCE